MGRTTSAKKLKVIELLKLDFGCGPHKRDGFSGVDIHSFEGQVDYLCDLRTEWTFRGVKPSIAKWNDETERELGWYLPDNSVSEANASHFIEHLTADERIHFYNELYRVLVPNGTCQITTPHWASCRAYGDPTHQWPPVSEFAWYYLSREWRKTQAPHTGREYLSGGYACDFEATWGYAMRPDLLIRNEAFQQFAMANYKEVILDMICTVKAKK